MFLTRAPASEAGGDRSAYGNWWFEPVGMRTTGGMALTSASAMGVPTVWACINVLAKSFAMMPFRLYRPKKDGRGREKLTKHWLYRLLAKAPNRFQSPFEWRQMMMGHLALRGNAFNQILANGRGEIVELLPLHPDRMQLETLPNGEYRYLYSDQNGKQQRYLPSEIWHLRGLSSDGFVGLSPIEVARESIGESLAMQSYAARFYANDTRPGGWIQFDGKFSTDGAKQAFRDSWQKLQGGANSRKVAVLEKGFQYHELKLNNADAQFVESRAGKKAELASLWGIPPHKVGDLSKSTNNNIEHQSIEFWTDTMLPWAEAWESSISFFLLGEDGEDLEPQFDMSRLIRADSKSRGERIRSLVLAGVMAPNEGREEEGLDPLDGLDRPLRPLNMAQVNEDGSIDATEADTPAPDRRGAPDGGNDPGKADAMDPRLLALAGAAADRIARKEVEMVAKAGGDRTRLVTAYEKHVGFVASALNVSDDDAAMYCAGQVALMDERPGLDAESMGDIARARLERLALGGKPEPVNVGANAMLRLANAISVMPTPVVNSTTNVAPAAITVQPAEVHNHVDVAAPNVTVERTEVHNHVPEQRVDVHVASPKVEVRNEIPESPAPVIHVDVQPAKPEVTVIQSEPKQAGQQDRPWPTQTVIKQRDAQGRADVIETRPLDN